MTQVLKRGWLMAAAAMLIAAGLACQSDAATEAASADAALAAGGSTTAPAQSGRSGADGLRKRRGRRGPGAGRMGPGRGGPMGGPGMDGIAQGGGRQGSPEARQKREAVEAKIKALRIYQLTELLELDDAASQAFFPKLARFDEAQRTQHRERRETYGALRDLMDAQASGEAVDAERVKALVAKDVALAAAEGQIYTDFVKDIEATLGSEKAAQFVVYQREFEHQLRRLIRATMRGEDPSRQAAELEKLKAAGRPGAGGGPAGP